MTDDGCAYIQSMNSIYMSRTQLVRKEQNSRFWNVICSDTITHPSNSTWTVFTITTNSDVTVTTSIRCVGIYETTQPLNVFGSLSDWDTSTSFTGGRSPDPAPSSWTPGLPSFFGAFCSTAVTTKSQDQNLRPWLRPRPPISVILSTCRTPALFSSLASRFQLVCDHHTN